MAADVVPEGYTLEPPAAPKGTELPPGYTFELPPGYKTEQPVNSLKDPYAASANLASGINRGVARLLDLPLDAPQHLWNLGAEWWNQQEKGGKPQGWGQIPQYEPPHYFERGMRAIGGGKEAALGDYVGGLLNRVGEFAGAAAVPLGEVTSLAQFLKMLGLGAASGATAVGAKETAKAAGAGPGVQQLAEMAGSFVPGASIEGAAAAKSKLLRGAATPEEVAANTAEFRRAGVEPTVGQATGSTLSQGVENLLAKVPASGIPILERARQQTDVLGQQISDMSKSLSNVRTKPAAARHMQEDLRDFVSSGQSKFGELDNTFKQSFNPAQRFPVTNVQQKLGELTETAPDLPGISGSMKDPNIVKWNELLKRDTAGSPEQVIPPTPARQVPTQVLGPNGQPVMRTVPGTPGQTIPAKPWGGASMQSLIDLRSDIGTQISNRTILGQKPDAQYDALYKAISDDIAAAAKNTPAEAALARRDNYWKAFRNRVDTYLDQVATNVNKTQAYQDALGKSNLTREEAMAVRRSVTPDTWDKLTATKLVDLGKDTEHGQFTLGQFSREYRKLDDRPTGSTALSTADAIFGGRGTYKQNLDTIADVAEKISAAGKVYANPSGTAAAAMGGAHLVGLPGAMASAVIRGKFGEALTYPIIAAASLGNSRMLAKMMVDPRTVDWLAKSTRIKPENAQTYLKTLTPIINDMQDPIQKKALQDWQRDTQAKLSGAVQQARAKLQTRAYGGPVEQGQPYLVGEQGPELVVPDQDGTVLPNPFTSLGGLDPVQIAGDYAIRKQYKDATGQDLDPSQPTAPVRTPAPASINRGPREVEGRPPPNVEGLARKLVETGRAPNMPAALIQAGQMVGWRP